MNLLARAGRLSVAEMRLLTEAIFGLVVSGVLIRFWRFRVLAAHLGRHMAESPIDQDRAQLAVAQSIRWAIHATARRLPWHPVCLPQALTAQWMLRRRGITSTLYLGVDPGSRYDAHAWVRAGALIVTGGPRRPEFVVVSTFA